MLELNEEEQTVMDAFRKAKAMEFADIAISINCGMLGKLYVTEKKVFDTAPYKGRRVKES